MNILLVEDDRKLSRALSTMLEEDGHVVEAAYDGRRGLELGLENPYDVIILDVMLPQLDGISVCRTLRGKHIDIPVLMLTARTTVGDRVQGLDAGADDYLPKPFAFRELMARLRALARRQIEVREVDRLEAYGLELDLRRSFAESAIAPPVVPSIVAPPFAARRTASAFTRTAALPGRPRLPAFHFLLLWH